MKDGWILLKNIPEMAGYYYELLETKTEPEAIFLHQPLYVPTMIDVNVCTVFQETRPFLGYNKSGFFFEALKLL